MNGAHHMRIQCDTIDHMAERLGPPSVLKIDVEGAEHLVLEGGRSVLHTYRPALVIECNKLSLQDAGVEPQAFLDDLRGMGYTLWHLRRPLYGFHRWSRRTKVTSALQLPELSNLVALLMETDQPERHLSAIV